MITNLLLALSFFIVSHAIPAFPGVKQVLVSQIGRPAYLTAYILISFGAFIWLISAALTAPSWQIWEPVEIHFTLALFLMFLSSIALALGLVVANPLSLTIRAPRPEQDLSPSLSWTRHPLLFALVFWALGHVIANGDTTGVLLFGTLGAFAALYIPVLDRRKKQAFGHVTWTALCKTAPLLPFGNGIRPSFNLTSLCAGAAGAALFLALLVLHEPLIGLSPLWIFTR